MTDAHHPVNAATPGRRTVLLAFGASAASVLLGAQAGHPTAGRLSRREATRTPVAPTSRPEPMPRPVALESQVTSRSATIVTKPPATDIVIAFAMAQRGATYVWGATGPNTFDCSGLTLRAYQAAGIQLPRTSREQARVGTRIPVSAGVGALAPGDLVFWAYQPSNLSTVHHVAIYLGNGQVVHAPQTGDVVKVSPIWPTGYAGGVRMV